MAKLKFKGTCRYLREELPEITKERLQECAFHPCAQGAESSIGFVPVTYYHDELRYHQSGWTCFRVCMESRKPPKKVVDGMTAKRFRKLKEDGLPVDKNTEARIKDQVKAELWDSISPTRKHVFVFLKDTRVIVLSDYNTFLKVSHLLRLAYGTFMTDGAWDGSAFSKMVVDHLTEGGDLGLNYLRDSISFTMINDNSSVTVDNDPDIEEGPVPDLLRPGATVHTVGFQATGVDCPVVIDACSVIVGEVEMEAAGDEDEDFGDAIIALDIVHKVMREVVSLTTPFNDHTEEVEEDVSDD